jgi:hypothetical protein
LYWLSPLHWLWGNWLNVVVDVTKPTTTAAAALVADRFGTREIHFQIFVRMKRERVLLETLALA